MISQADFSSAASPRFYPSQQHRSKSLKSTHKGIILWHVFLACYYLCNQLCSAHSTTHESSLVDLSHVFDNTTIYWVTAKPLAFNVTHKGLVEDKGYWYQSDEFSAATHGGTHMDAPCHFAKDTWCVSDIPIERLVAPAVVIDISSKVQNNPEMHLMKNDLLNWEKQNGEIPKGSLLLVRTGWARFWPDPLTYSGTDQRDVNMLRFPSILPEAAEWLVANRDIVGVGIDSMSVDVPNSRPLTHITLMEKNIYGLENVNLPDDLPATGATVYVMPMKLRYASGAPCRIFAHLNGITSASSCKTCSPSVVFAMVALCSMALFWSKREI